MAVFPGSFVFFWGVASIATTVENSFVVQKVEFAIGNELATVNQTGKVFPIVNCFAVVHQATITDTGLGIAGHTFNFRFFFEVYKLPI